MLALVASIRDGGVRSTRILISKLVPAEEKEEG